MSSRRTAGRALCVGSSQRQPRPSGAGTAWTTTASTNVSFACGIPEPTPDRSIISWTKREKHIEACRRWAWGVQGEQQGKSSGSWCISVCYSAPRMQKRRHHYGKARLRNHHKSKHPWFQSDPLNVVILIITWSGIYFAPCLSLSGRLHYQAQSLHPHSDATPLPRGSHAPAAYLSRPVLVLCPCTCTSLWLPALQ